MIRLVDVDDTNRDACLGLALSPDQESFIPSVQSSLELASQYPEAKPLAIVRDPEGVVGFAMVGVDSQTGLWKIYRLLVDRRYQGEGVGKLALAQLLRRVHEEHRAAEILVSFQPENSIARRLYARFDFVEVAISTTKITAKASLPSKIASLTALPPAPHGSI